MPAVDNLCARTMHFCVVGRELLRARDSCAYVLAAMARPKVRRDPNAADPLSEPTVNRRLHAAYLAKGWDRATFARKMGVKYQTVDRWDIGEIVPGVDNLFRASELVGYTPAQLLYGRDGVPPTSASAGGVDNDDSNAVEREAFGLLMRELAESLEPMFVVTFRAELEDGATREAAFAKARDRALAARSVAMKRRALADAVSLGGKPATGFAAPPAGPAIRTRKATPPSKD